LQYPFNCGDASAVLSEPVAPSEKVAFLRRPTSYGGFVDNVMCRETHMSWIFLAGDRVLKLKKPVRFPYLDFSTLAKRHAACAAELSLNRRLALYVYENIMPLTNRAGRLSIGGDGEIVDWLVIMRRLEDSGTLEQALIGRQLEVGSLDPLIDGLSQFYRRAKRINVPARFHVSQWWRRLSENRRVLLGFGSILPVTTIRFVDRVQIKFLIERANVLAMRALHGRIVDGHGDLRPEHIWLGPPVRIIDCLEFNRQLRTVDPLDEIAYLCLECDRLGGKRHADYIKRRSMAVLQNGVSDELFTFYRCYRATLRARLAVAHLLEPSPRTPTKWPRLGRDYLELAVDDAHRLQRFLG
jgi:aminoglycoside phosphotransferase family enzyme